MNWFRRKNKTREDVIVAAAMKRLNRQLKLYAKLQKNGLKPMQAFDVAEHTVVTEDDARNLKNITR